MGKALQVVSGFVTATTGGGTFDPVTNNTGDSQAVRNYAPGSAARILDAWISDGTGTPAPTVHQVKSPLMHDNVDGIQVIGDAATAQPLWPSYASELVYAQDVLSVNLAKISAGAGGPTAESMLLYYEDLPGSNARLYRWPDLASLIDHSWGVQVAITTSGATAGDYDGPTAINATQDQFKANRDYAILGATCEDELGTIGITGPDTSNTRVGIPGSASLKDSGRSWFITKAVESGYPCIPVINAANKNATIVDVTDPNGNLPTVVTIWLARLRQNIA